MSTVTVVYLVAGTVVERSFTAERITFQRHRKRGLMVKLWSGGKVVEYHSYERAPYLHRIDTEPEEHR